MNKQRRYRAIVNEIRRERGDICEACGEPATHPHHIIPVSETSIHSELVFAKENMILLCDDCHTLMHPGYRDIGWDRVRIGRGLALSR